MSAFPTYTQDVDRLILSLIRDRSALINASMVDTYMYKTCNEFFWKTLFISEFGVNVDTDNPKRLSYRQLCHIFFESWCAGIYIPNVRFLSAKVNIMKLFRLQKDNSANEYLLIEGIKNSQDEVIDFCLERKCSIWQVMLRLALNKGVFDLFIKLHSIGHKNKQKFKITEYICYIYEKDVARREEMLKLFIYLRCKNELFFKTEFIYKLIEDEDDKLLPLIHRFTKIIKWEDIFRYIVTNKNLSINFKIELWGLFFDFSFQYVDNMTNVLYMATIYGEKELFDHFRQKLGNKKNHVKVDKHVEYLRACIDKNKELALKLIKSYRIKRGIRNVGFALLEGKYRYVK